MFCTHVFECPTIRFDCELIKANSSEIEPMLQPQDEIRSKKMGPLTMQSAEARMPRNVIRASAKSD
jgi:hypothetical protein